MLPEIFECLVVAAGTGIVLLALRAVRNVEPLDQQPRPSRRLSADSVIGHLPN